MVLLLRHSQGPHHYIQLNVVLHPNHKLLNTEISTKQNKYYLLLSEFEGRNESNGPRFSSSIHGASLKHEGHEMKGKIKVPKLTDRENEVNKMIIISLGNWIEMESTQQSQAVCTLEYGPLNQAITAHVEPERYHKKVVYAN